MFQVERVAAPAAAPAAAPVAAVVRVLAGKWALAGTILCTAAATTACDSPYEIDWTYAVPDTVVIYSLSRAEYAGYASVFDFVSGFALPIETAGALGAWDLAFVEDGVTASFLLPGAIPGNNAHAMIQAVPGITFAELTRAPAEGYDSISVSIEMNTVYVLRTREIDDGTGTTCRYTVKLEPLAFDTLRGTLELHYLFNPNCGSRDLDPA